MYSHFRQVTEMSHRQVLTGIYLALTAILVGEIILFWPETVQALRDYLQGGGIAGYAAIGIAYSTPISASLLAWLIHRRVRNPVMFLLVAHTIFIFDLAVLPAVYLLWWYLREGKDNVQKNV